jgi:hypothetical protein
MVAVCLPMVIACRRRIAGMPEIGLVEGTVTLDGKPLGNAVVRFSSANDRTAFGITGTDGRYVLRYLADVPGAEIGRSVVSIMMNLDAPPAPGTRSAIPDRYNTNTSLSAEVKPGRNTFDFKLESR